MLIILLASRIVVTEVMANPAGAAGARMPEDRNEFVELHNTGPQAVDLLDWILDDGDSKDRLVAWQDSSILDGYPTLDINSTWLRPGGYAVVLDSEYTAPDPAGGYERPYAFGDSALILTTRNTTLGNGLAVADPVIVSSPAGDTSTFGTPWDDTDSIPGNPGDGLSWERIDAHGPDSVGNWVVCPDSSGSTPGAANAVSIRPDLAVRLLLVSPPAEPGARFELDVSVDNAGYVRTTGWELRVFLDRNGNESPDPHEEIRLCRGPALGPGAVHAETVAFTCPRVRTDAWAIVECEGDRVPGNNRARVAVGPPGTAGHLAIAASSFSPNGDGFEDSLAVVCRLPEPGGDLRVLVLDLAGRVVRCLHDGRAGSEQALLYWTGRRDNGERVAAGVYAVWLGYHLPDLDITEKLPVALLK